MTEISPENSSYGELLEWHLSRGTRPNPAGLFPWQIVDFAREVRSSPRSVARWLRGSGHPRFPIVVERALFGTEESELREQLRRALKRDVQDREDSKRGSYSNYGHFLDSLSNLQSYACFTNLNEEDLLISVTINIRPIDNQIGADLDRLTLGSDIEICRDFDEFLLWSAGGLSREANHMEVRLRQAIDHEHAILYVGSINAASSSELSKLPQLLKAMASLSSRQFRVGLFRLGVSIIVLGTVSAISGAAAWEGARMLREFGDNVIHDLRITHEQAADHDSEKTGVGLRR